ncbi:hypothetical protein Gotur_026088 [Gossypium turneri]
MGKGRAPCCDKDKVKRGPWSPQEDLRLITFIQKHGHENWRALPKQADLPGRTDNEIKNVWNTYLKKRLAPKNGKIPQNDESKEICMVSSSCSSITFVSSPCGKRNLEVELEQQWHEGSPSKKPREGFY